MKSNSFVVIQGWMCNELNLKGNELLVFALIYGFSQDNESFFTGSRKYIADTFNISLPTVDKALSGLVEKNLIVRDASEELSRPVYYVDVKNIENLIEECKETLQGGVKKLYRGSKETLHNNNSNNIDRKNKKNNSKELLQKTSETPTKKRQNLYQKCLDMLNEFTTDMEVRMLLLTYLNFRLEVRDKPLYANMWKGMLAKLEKIHKDNSVSYNDVIQQSIDRGYLSFYPVVSYSSSQKDISGRAETDYDYQEGWREEMEKNGKKVEF